MGSYSRTGYMALKKETTENVAVTPDTFIPFLNENVFTEWGEQFSQSVVANRMKNYRAVDRAIPAPSGDLTIEVESNLIGHFLLSAIGAVTTGVYFPITSLSADFTVGETVTGGTSSETATVVKTSTEGDYVLVSSPSGEFTDGETITGGTSGSTATLTKMDADAMGHEYTFPQTTIDETFTVEFGKDNEVIRYTGVRFHNITLNQTENIITATISVMARTEFSMARVTAVTSSGAGSQTITVDQTTGLAASDTIKAYRPSTSAFLDFSASSVKTHSVDAVSSETAFTITNLQTSLAVGDLIVLAPQTPTYSVEDEFIWAGGTNLKVADTISAAVAASGDGDIEDYEISVMNDLEARHTADGTNLVNRFPSRVFTAGADAAGSLSRTYINPEFMDRVRTQRATAIHMVTVGNPITDATDFNHTLDIRVANTVLGNYDADITEDDLLNEDIPMQGFDSSSDGYAVKILLINDISAY